MEGGEGSSQHGKSPSGTFCRKTTNLTSIDSLCHDESNGVILVVFRKVFPKIAIGPPEHLFAGPPSKVHPTGTKFLGLTVDYNRTDRAITTTYPNLLNRY